MSKSLTKFNANIAAEFKTVFGPPPVHKTADENIYDAILYRLAKDIGPRDFIEQIFLRDLADHVHETQWLRRLRTKLIRQAHKEKFQEFARQVIAGAELRKESLRKGDDPGSFFRLKSHGPDPNKRDPEAEAALNAEIEKIDAETKKTLVELQKAEDGPTDEAALFEKWIGPYELVERRLAVAEQNLRTTLKLLDEHRHGLGQRLRQVADEIVDVEFDEEPEPAREDPVAAAAAFSIPAAIFDSSPQAQPVQIYVLNGEARVAVPSTIESNESALPPTGEPTKRQ
jgi:hypothetical protein